MRTTSRLALLLACAMVSGACSKSNVSRPDSIAPAAVSATGVPDLRNRGPSDPVRAGTPAGTPSGPAVVRVRVDEQNGVYLTDENGRALYLFDQDRRGHSTCDDDCALAWPPYLTRGAPMAGDPAVRPSLLSTTRRNDGREQVTYGGWPLYYDADDTARGAVQGQGVDEYGAKWYLVAPSGARQDGKGRPRRVTAAR